MSQNTAGGAAAAGGIDYQARFAAWVSTRILASAAVPPLEGVWTGPLERIDCETGEPVDDIRVRPQTGPAVVIQCKRQLSLETAADSNFGKTIDQFVGQHRSAGHETDQLVLATTTETSATIRNTLRLLLGRIRDLPTTDDIAAAVKNLSEEAVLKRVLDHVRRAWKDQTALEPTDAEVRDLLRSSHVLILDLDPGQASEQEAHATLAGVVADPTQIPSAWALLNSHADAMAKNRTGADLPGIQGHLAANHIDLMGIVELQDDVTKLKDATARELDRLDGGLVAIPGPAADINITRTIITQVEAAAAAGPVLVTGDPGTGKTVAVYHLARSLQAAGDEVAFLPVGNLRAGSLGELANELGLGHPLNDVLSQWSPGTPKTLILDSLDAARGDGQPDLWRQVIEHVTTKLPDWRVVVTVRSWDLQHSRHLLKQFPNPPIVIGDLDDTELDTAASGWPELAKLVADAPASFRALIRNPYNLRLAADLLREGTPLGTLEGLNSQLELLDTYWELRVTSGAGGGARQLVARSVSRRALEQHTMKVDTAPVLVGDAGASTSLSELLSVAVLVDATAVTVPGLPAVVRYSHHVLHDYALSLEFSGTAGLVGEVKRDPNLVIAVAPSIDLHLQRLWDVDPQLFWATVIELHEAGDAALAVVQAADIAARNLSDVSELTALTDPIQAGTGTDRNTTLLRYLALAYVLDRWTDPTIASGPWADLALALSGHLDQTELIVRILVGELVTVDPPITGDALDAVGAAARAALEHMWEGQPNAVNRVAINSVIRSSASDPAATEALLRCALEPERLVSHGASDLWAITNGVPTLAAHSPAFVQDLYVVVMGYQEQSREATDMSTGQLLALRSNRHQDIESAKYNLVEHFDTVLATAPAVAVHILRQIVPTRTTTPAEHTVTLNGRTFTVLAGSEWYDDWGYANGSDPATMLDEFETVLAETDDPSPWVDLLAERPTPAVIWGRVLSAAAGNRALAAALGPLDIVVGALAVPSLGAALARVVAAEFSGTDAATRSNTEQVVRALEPAGDPQDYASYQAEQLYRHLLHALDRDQVGDGTKAAIDATQPADDQSTRIGGPVDFDRYRGIDLSDATDKRVSELLDEIEPFMHTHFNELPTPEQLRDHDAAIDELEGIVDGGYQGGLADRAAEVLARVAVIWGRLPMDVAGNRHQRARVRLLCAAGALAPEPRDEQADDGEMTTIRSGPRTDAARGLTALARLPEHANSAVLEAITALSQDPVSSVRYEIISRLGYLRATAPDLIWKILDDRAAEDTSEAVLRAVVHAAWNHRADMARAAGIVDAVANRATSGRKRQGAAAACADAAAVMWVMFGDEIAHGTATRLLDLDALDVDAISSVLHTLRKNGCFTAEDTWMRQRTLELCTTLVAQGRTRLARLTADPPPSEDEQPAIREGAKLLDAVSHQLYFATGVHDAKQVGARPPLPEEIRLVDEAGDLLDELAQVALAPVVHHLVEIHAFMVDARPVEALAAIARVVTGGGRPSGYAVESLAVGVLVDVVSRLLADHRSIFEDPDNLTSLRVVLEVFIEAGSPDAHQLIYGLGQIFR